MDGLSSICAGLGLLDEDENGKIIGYAKGEYCSDNLKDLLRFLRRDDPEKRDVFKQVCKWNIVGKDLIPIIEYCQEDHSLVLNAVKVLVFLTMPVEPTSTDIPQQIEYLWGLKSAITFSGIVPVIVSLLESPLENLESESFTEDDWKLVQLVLTLFRNILAIQDISTQQKAGGSATQFISLRDRFLDLLFQENVMDLILVLSQHVGGSHGYLRQDNLLLLEIFYYIFKGQEPELIAKAHLKASQVEEDADSSVTSLQYIMKEEKEKRKLTRIHNLSCYSKFTGTFTQIALDGSKAHFKGNPSASGDALLKAHKNHRGPSKRETWHHAELPSTKNKLLQLLDDFISQFLMGGYNVLMQSIRDDIDKEHQEIQSSDVVIFFHVAQFVTSFQYQKCSTSKPSIHVDNEASAACLHDNTLFNGSMCGPIAETLNESMFLMVISKWRYAFEGLKQTNDYKFLSVSGSLVKIMIRMLDLVLKQSPDVSKEPQTARILLYKLFYDQTEEGMTQFLLNLIKSFDTQKQSKSDLADLVESMHVVLRLLENLQARGTLRVSKKLRKKKTNKTMTKDENVCEPSGDNVTTQNEVGSSTCEETIDINMLERETLTDQDFDIERDNSRDPIHVDEPAPKPANLGSNEPEVDDRNIVDDGGHYLESDNSSGDEQLVLTNEVDFKVSSLVSALANNTIIQNLCWLLKFYKSNSITTNHYILSMLRRICDDLELSPMLYQLSLLTIFYDILEEQESRPCKEYENIVTFLRSLVRRMLRKMKSYPLLLVEVLFWKTRKECHYINCGSMLNELNCMKNELAEGSMKNGGNCLSEGQKWVRRSIADALGDDDFVISSQNSLEKNDPFEDEFQKFRQSSEEGNETSTSILGKVIDGSAISDREGHTEEKSDRSSKIGNGLLLSDEMDSRLEDLYEKYKDNPHCCQLIAGELDPDGDLSKVQVSRALKQLGFKVPAKAKIQNSDASNRARDDKGDLSRGSTDPHNAVAGEISSLRKPMHSRKRVQAFSVDQEQKIKDLFEQFKDHKRCSYMIANALDDTGKISAARVSHKLKQLGLIGPKKRTRANMHLRDEVSSDVSSEGAGNSADETLLSLRHRGKQKRNGSHSDKRHNKKIARKLPEDTSDDELLSSVLAITKKMSQKSDDEQLYTDSIEKNLVEINSVGRDPQYSERFQCFLTTLLGSMSMEEISACNGLSSKPSPAKVAAMPVSKSETSETFFNNLSNRIQHGLESGMDLQNLAERVVKSSIHWLHHKCEKENNSEGQESMRNLEDSCIEAVGEKLIKLLLTAPKEMKKIHQDSSSEHVVREYEMQILLRLEILRSDVSAMIEESRKQKLLKQICSLLEIIQYLVAGGIHGHVSLYDYIERTIRSRYSDELDDVMKEIYTRMDLLPFGDDDETPNLLFNSEDSNQSWKEKYDRNENNSVSAEGESSQPLANAFEEIEKDEHTRILNEARERRERARRFAPFISKTRDLQRVWAPKNPKSTKCKFDSLSKKSKRRGRQTPSYSVVCETPMTGNQRACFRENNKGDKENPVSKALFQDN